MADRQQSIKLFISHSSKDRELASLLLKAIQASFSVPDSHILCSSLTGYQLRGGANIAGTLQTEIRDAKAVMGILTPNSIESPWVLCELGAAWGLITNFVPVLAGLDPDKVRGPLGVAHVWQLDKIDDVLSSLREVGRYLGASSRQLTRDEENKVLQNVVSFAEKYRPETQAVPVTELYALHLPFKEIRSNSKVFQDFNVSRRQGNDVNAVHFLWADTFTNGSIKALIMREADEHYLRIWFENGMRTETQGERAKGWASSIKIRPQDEKALGNETEERA